MLRAALSPLMSSNRLVEAWPCGQSLFSWDLLRHGAILQPRFHLLNEAFGPEEHTAPKILPNINVSSLFDELAVNHVRPVDVFVEL
jgi:hypothetical protein